MAETDTENAETEAAAVKPRSNVGLIVGFVSVVVLVETGMFFFLVPSAEQVSAIAEANLIKAVQEGEQEAAQQEVDENERLEIELGEFGETFSPIDTERSFRVELRLYGLVYRKNMDRMKEELDAKQGRLRHAIRMKIRNSEIAELTDNQLALLERRILTTCNHLLEEDYLLGVGYHDYQLLEQ
ncbi:MAG: dihydrolipoamide acetyltransferase [Planctomycetota bacterium]